VSLRPVLDDPAKVVKDAAFTQVRRGTSHGFSIRTDRWRYMLWDDGRRGEQLFDMRADPGETANLAGKPEFAETTAELKRRIREYAKGTP
jgi:arylsulfatase A-like enzyme